MTDKVGLPTLNDILSELAKPGRDPREQFELFQFADGVNKIEDVKPGMKLPGIVTNVTAFGAFVDIGVHQDGLVHISQLADRFVKDPSEVVKVQQRVEVTVMEVDLARKRIGLSMKKGPTAAAPRPAAAAAPGARPPGAMSPGAMSPEASSPGASSPVKGGPTRPSPAPRRPSGPPVPAKEGWLTAALRDAKGK